MFTSGMSPSPLPPLPLEKATRHKNNSSSCTSTSNNNNKSSNDIMRKHQQTVGETAVKSLSFFSSLSPPPVLKYFWSGGSDSGGGGGSGGSGCRTCGESNNDGSGVAVETSNNYDEDSDDEDDNNNSLKARRTTALMVSNRCPGNPVIFLGESKRDEETCWTTTAVADSSSSCCATLFPSASSVRKRKNFVYYCVDQAQEKRMATGERSCNDIKINCKNDIKRERNYSRKGTADNEIEEAEEADKRQGNVSYLREWRPGLHTNEYDYPNPKYHRHTLRRNHHRCWYPSPGNENETGVPDERQEMPSSNIGDDGYEGEGDGSRRKGCGRPVVFLDSSQMPLSSLQCSSCSSSPSSTSPPPPLSCSSSSSCYFSSNPNAPATPLHRRTRQGYHPLFPVKRKLPWRNPHQQNHSFQHHLHPRHNHNPCSFPSLQPTSNSSNFSSTFSSIFPSLFSPSSPSSLLSSPTLQVYFYIGLVLLSLAYPTCHGNPDAKRLYDDLLSNYNRLIRPVSNNTQTVLVRLGLRLSQLIDLNLKDQILTTNVWLEHEWEDHKFKWDPHEYGGVTELYVPSENIWLPDIVLYNNADGEYVVTTMTKAVLHSDGKVRWTPPAIFKSSCEIDVRYFPFDMQTCFMKFGSWTYDGFQIDLKHIDQLPGKDHVDIGIDLREYYPSVEWDILSVPAERHEKFYPCCLEPYPDIFFNITLRRRTLFYTVNLIIPTVGISYLSILVFYLPADSGEKVALCISILLSQTMFFLLISEIIPSTSLAVPLLGKYLLFTMLLVGLSVLVTTIVLNVHYRKPSTHRMAPWVRNVFTRILPKFLLMRVPDHVLNYSSGPSARGSPTGSRDDGCNGFQGVSRLSGLSLHGISGFLEQGALEGFPGPASTSYGLNGPDPDNARKKYPFEIQKAIHNVKFIQTHMQRQDEFDSEDQDWGFVAMVLDRIFLMLFNTAFFVGTVMILLDAPALYDYSEAIDKVISTIAKTPSNPDPDI